MGKDNKNLQETADRYKTFISDNWEKVNDDIYLDKKSIKRDKEEISAWFKMFNSKDNVDGVQVYYDLIQYEVDCKSPALCCNHIITFDKNGKLLADYPDYSAICINGKSGWFHGETAYDILCKYKE